MDSKTRLRGCVALIVLVGATALVTDAFHNRLWGNVLLGCLTVIGCLAFLRGLPSRALSEPRPADLPRYDRTDSLTVLVDEVPLPLLRYSPIEGLQAINRAARSLFHTDDTIVEPPKGLLDAITTTDPGAQGSLMIFGRTYAVGISEFISADYTLRLISLTDIQSEIRVAEATALRDLLRVLSHEIMNSLTPVANLAGIARTYLLNETSTDALAARDALDLLSERASGLARFVEAYRSMARLPEPILRPVDLRQWLLDSVRVFKQGLAAKNVTIELDLPPECPTLDLDETLLTQALLNVLTNAAEATAQTPDPGIIRVSIARERQEVRVYVSDTGCGVPDSLAEPMFHAFITTKPNGTGTGLNLARQIALAHGGDLLFLGPQERWSAVFALALPVSPNITSHNQRSD